MKGFSVNKIIDFVQQKNSYKRQWKKKDHPWWYLQYLEKENVIFFLAFHIFNILSNICNHPILKKLCSVWKKKKNIACSKNVLEKNSHGIIRRNFKSYKLAFKYINISSIAQFPSFATVNFIKLFCHLARRLEVKRCFAY